MSEPVYRYDIVGTIVPAAVRDGQCPRCGADVNSDGRCSQRDLCERRDGKQVERQG